MTTVWFKPPLKKKVGRLWVYVGGIILGIMVGSSIAIFKVMGKLDFGLHSGKTEIKQECYVDIEDSFSSRGLEDFFLKAFPSNISYADVRAEGKYKKEFIVLVKGDFKKYEDAVQTSKKLDNIDVKNYLQESKDGWRIAIEADGDEIEINKLKDVIKSKTGIDVDIYPKNMTQITFKLSLGPYKNCENILGMLDSLGLTAKERKK